MPTELDLQTIDDGSVYLGRKLGDRSAPGRGVFTLEVTNATLDVARVQLTRVDLLTLVTTAAKLLAEDEIG